MAPLLLLAGIVAFAITLSLPLAAAIYVTEMGLWFFAIWRWTTLSRRGLAMSNRLPPSEALMVLEKHRPR